MMNSNDLVHHFPLLAIQRSPCPLCRYRLLRPQAGTACYQSYGQAQVVAAHQRISPTSASQRTVPMRAALLLVGLLVLASVADIADAAPKSPPPKRAPPPKKAPPPKRAASPPPKKAASPPPPKKASPPPPKGSVKRSPPPPPPAVVQPQVFPTAWSFITNQTNMKYLAACVQKAGLVSVLSDPNLNATLLAPNDAAFLALLSKLTLAGRLVDKNYIYNTTSLLNDPNLSAILLYHLIPNVELFQSDFYDGETLSSFSKHIVTVKRDKVTRFLDEQSPPTEAGISSFNNRGGKTIVHVLTKVLLPTFGAETAVPPPPSPSPSPFPPPSPSPAPPSPSPSPPPPPPTLYNYISNEQNSFTLLKALVDSVGAPFVGALNNNSAGITVFMPTDQSFQNLLTSLGSKAVAFQSDKAAVAATLALHVIPFFVPSNALVNGATFPTLAGINVTVVAKGSNTNITTPSSSAHIRQIDGIVRGQNIAYPVDGVLLLPTPSPSPSPSPSPAVSPSPPSSSVQPSPSPSPSPSPAPVKSLYDIVASTSNLVILKQLVDLAGAPFNTTLKNTSAAVTVFAPVDTAFTALLSQFGAAAATNRTLVAGLLAGHIVPFPIFSSQLRNGQQLPTLAGYNLTVSINGSVVTIIAPGSHALVIAANITGGASVAHLVDAVLLPPAPAPTPSPSPPPPKSLYDIVSANNQTTILKQLVDLAGAPFNTTLKNTSAAVTVFAPVDAAFQALLKQFGAALATNKTAVSGLLAGHVVPYPVFSSQLRNGQQLPTLAGYNLTVSINGSAVSVVAPGSRALVLIADITGGSSVAHVIDTVLLPPAAAGRRLRA